MKKLVFSIGLGLALATSAFAADDILNQLNSQAAKLLAPLQNEATVAQLNFNTLDANDERVFKVSGNALYRKTGSQNTFEVKVDNLSYDYGIGSSPMTLFTGSLGLDFTKLISQDKINEMLPLADRMMEEIGMHYAEVLGDAVSIKSVVTSKTKDVDGNYTGATALLSAKIDLTKLPEYIQSEDIIFTDASISVTLDVKTGAKIDAYAVSNPDYQGFQSHQIGLKEVLDLVLTDDEEALNMMIYQVKKLDDMVTILVEMGSLKNINLLFS